MMESTLSNFQNLDPSVTSMALEISKIPKGQMLITLRKLNIKLKFGIWYLG